MRYNIESSLRNILLIILMCAFNQLIAQEKVNVKDIYFENDLAYKISNNKIFTGNVQKIRENGHLVFEENYENGYLTKMTTFYNSTDEPIPARVTEYFARSLNRKTEILYGLKSSTTDVKHFDLKGQKILIERYEKEKLIYRCSYINNKKYGIEFCLNDDGKEFKYEYSNGRKIKK